MALKGIRESKSTMKVSRTISPRKPGAQLQWGGGGGGGGGSSTLSIERHQGKQIHHEGSYMPYFSGAILGFSGNFSGTNDQMTFFWDKYCEIQFWDTFWDILNEFLIIVNELENNFSLIINILTFKWKI